MQTIRDRVAGLDVHRDRVVACARIGDNERVATVKRSFSTMAVDVADLGDWLVANGVTAVMESTGVLEVRLLRTGGQGARVVAGEHDAREDVPGRKTDVSDASGWRMSPTHGMVRPSYVRRRPFASCVAHRYRAPQVDARTGRFSVWRRCCRTPGSS